MARSEVSKPVFSQPQTVISKSSAEITKALDSRDVRAALRPLINRTLAQNEINSDSMPAMLQLIDSIASLTYIDPVSLSLVNLLRASIYNDIYMSQRYAIAQRPDASPLTDDYSVWSRGQFESRIIGLLNSAMAQPESLKAVPSRKVTDLFTLSDNSALFYPSLLDIVAFNCADMALRLDTPDSRRIATEYIATLKRLDSGEPAPSIMADLWLLNTSSRSADYTRSALYKLLDTYPSTQFIGEIIIALGNITYPSESIAETKKLYDIVRNFKARYPSYVNIGCIKNLISRLSAKNVEISAPSIVYPGNKLKIKASSLNTPSATVTLYRVNKEILNRNTTNVDLKEMKSGDITEVAVRKVNFNGTVPFADTVEVELTMPDNPGNFVAVVTASGMKRYDYPPLIRSSRLSVAIMKFNDITPIVVDPFTGAPVSGVTVMNYDSPGKSQPLPSLTDSLGMTDPITDNVNLRLYPVKGSDSFAHLTALYKDYASERNPLCVEGFTALPLCRPGDSMKWCATAYYARSSGYETAAGVKLYATLFNANRQPVDTATVIADRYGRVEGEFSIPQGELTGLYSIQLSESPDESSLTEIPFEVSDYKLPTFYITAEPAQTLPSGGVEVEGKATGYNGVAVADATVSVNISEITFWWRRSQLPSDFVPLTLETVTDSDGRWKVTLPAEAIALTNADAPCFRAEITVTSPGGESQSESTVFSKGNPLILMLSMPQNICLDNPEITLPVKVVDARMTPQTDITVSYTLNRLGSDGNYVKTSEGSITTPAVKVDWRNVASGTYRIDMTYGDDTQSAVFVAYRTTDTAAPSPEILWCPDSRLTLGADNSAKLIYSTAEDDSYILYTLYDEQKIYERRWIKSGAGLHTLPVVAPHGVTSLTATLMIMKNMQSEIIEVSLSTPVNPRDIIIKTESMRNRLMPGATETWTFKVENPLGVPVQSAMMIDMWNMALSSLAPHNPSFSLRPLPGRNSFNLITGFLDYPLGYSISDNTGYNRCRTTGVPAWELFNLSFRPQSRMSGIRVRGTAYGAVAPPAPQRMMKMEMADMAVNDAEYESAADGVLEEAAVTGAADTDNGANLTASPTQFRNSEVALGLFRPMLVTGADGVLNLEFTVPEANASWCMKAFAFTTDMRLTAIDSTFISAKPLMVKPNLPRFMRQGDSATVISSVTNTTDAEIEANVVVELFNPANGEIVSSSETTLLIQPSSTVTYTSEVNAPDNSPVLGFRIKAGDGNFTDGEQNIIEILPASTPVFTSQSFYIAPQSSEVSVTIPSSKGSITTLEYCENPLWYVVTALPGLSTQPLTTAPRAAEAIFSAAVAEGIIRANPAIAEALKEWTSSPDKSEAALTSRLQQNEELKTLLLKATPWMTDALSQTERMERLALLFDKSTVSQTYSKGVETLSKLLTSSGGFCWNGFYSEPSLWATMSVLDIMGSLEKLGFMPDIEGLDKIIASAIKYADNENVERYKKYPDADFFSYALTRSRFASPKPSGDVKAIIDREVRKVIDRRADLTLTAMAPAALLLEYNGKTSQARAITGDMTQFTESTPEKGTWFPSIENSAWGYLSYTAEALSAFTSVNPDSPVTAGLRQWLIVQKQATEWGESSGATQVIASIIGSSPRNIAPAQGSRITLNGKPLDISPLDRTLGYYRTVLPATDRKSTLKVSRKGDSPAWGSLITRSTSPLREVEPSSSPDLSIEKSIILPEGADTLAAGMKVTVKLVIRTGRNLNYVTIRDNRAACFEPVNQLPAPVWQDGVCFYTENRDAVTNIFVDTMPKGTYVLTYPLWVNNAGRFTTGIATAQSQYEPAITAHTGAEIINVNPMK